MWLIGAGAASRVILAEPLVRSRGICDRFLGARLAGVLRLSSLSFPSFVEYDVAMVTRTRIDPGRLSLNDFATASRAALAEGEVLELRVGDTAIGLTPDQSEVVLSLLDAGFTGPSIEVQAELTTGQAADILGVSRPTVVAMVDRGQIPATRIGVHRRLLTADVLEFRDRARSTRSEALDDLVAVSDDLGLYE
ncbi:hypothetical protein BH24ACT5_BH24ACT5_09240 [soil metagenome]